MEMCHKIFYLLFNVASLIINDERREFYHIVNKSFKYVGFQPDFVYSEKRQYLSMAQRNLFLASQMPTMDNDQLWNHPHPDPHLYLGNGSFMLPADGAASTAVLRPNDCPSSSFSIYIANSGALHEPYLHPSSTASSIRFPPDQVLSMPAPSFNQHRSSMVNSPTDLGRATFKRKNPSMPLAFSGSNTSEYYSAGSSSNLHISSNPVERLPVVRPQYWSSDPSSITNGYGNDNLSASGEDSQRNVRSRHNHTFHMEGNPAVVYSSSNLPHHFRGAGNLAGHGMEGQVSHVPMPMAPQGRHLSSDPSYSYEGNQSLAGANAISNSVGTNGVFRPFLNQSRNASSLPALHDPLPRGAGAGSNGHNQRSNPYRSSYTPVGFATASVEGGGTSGMEYVPSSRYPRPLSITGRSGYRNGRSRSSYNRSQSIYDEDGARRRWLSEGAVMMDRSTFYDSRNWYDQHRDMRLDIDNMSYEEILALEERIGNVSTGLSEETITGCLQEIIHCSSHQIDDDQEEGKCVICLEEYKDRDKLGMLRCRHDFHVDCIKNWLQIKNACPICKAAALSDSPKEKQT